MFTFIIRNRPANYRRGLFPIGSLPVLFGITPPHTIVREKCGLGVDPAFFRYYLAPCADPMVLSHRLRAISRVS
ncbi:MAG: hypothetical protein ACR2PY_07020 [Salinispira sp.]